jgi:hypothetical protein
MKRTQNFVLISASKDRERRLESFIRRRYNPRLKSYFVEQGPKKIQWALKASLHFANLILEFGEDSDKNQKLCETLKSIVQGIGPGRKATLKIEHILLCYSGELPQEVEIAQELCLQKGIAYDIAWKEFVEELSLENGLYPFNAINLQINMDDIPKSQFLSEIGIEPMLIPEGLANVAYRDNVIEERFWYWDEKAAAAYLYLKESRNYPVFYESFDILRKSVLQIVRKTFDELWGHSEANSNETPLLDLVALGVGSAEKELTTLQEILNQYHLRHIQLEPGERIHYIPVDISFPLLQNSLRSIYSWEKLRNALIDRSLVVNPILTDILRLYASQIKGNKNKLIAALGLLWNIPTESTFQAFTRIATPNDLLLIDAEFLGNRTNEQLKDAYRGKEIEDFCLHPLELLNQASQTKAQFQTTGAFGRSIYKSYSEFSEYSPRNGRIEVEIVEGPEPSKLLEAYNLPESARGHLQFGPLKNSKTVVILFLPKIKSLTPVILAYSTRFQFDEFNDYVNTTGFQIVQQHLNNDKGNATFGYFLLKPPHAKNV